MISYLAGDVALRQIFARLRAERIVPENLLEVGGGGGVDFPKRLARVRPFAARIDLADFDAGLLTDHLDRRRPFYAKSLLQEPKYISALLAHKTVVHPLARRD